MPNQWEGTKTWLRVTRRPLTAVVPAFCLALVATPGLAQKKYDEGASDATIRIGNTNPYSGSTSAYGLVGRTEVAFFKMVNDNGGINGRKIDFITYDDGYSPPKTVEMVRKLVEEDKVLLLFNTLGTPPNSASTSI
jgi:branched-chain amino acid transport system substrate-binding protein